MSDTSAAISILKEILDAWKSRNERAVAKQAGRLVFWNDGMLKELHEIADGKGNQETYAHLRRKFENTEKDVRRTMHEMMHAAMQMGPTKIAEQVGNVVSSVSYGKGQIRADIFDLLERGQSEDAASEALMINNSIERLNAELRRLYRMVYE
jgi:hypothetical protein